MQTIVSYNQDNATGNNIESNIEQRPAKISYKTLGTYFRRRKTILNISQKKVTKLETYSPKSTIK
jgi:hypothetical protein